jgi:hypothetical protein
LKRFGAEGDFLIRAEFLARRLLVGEIQGKKVLIGTPLYVAQTDDDNVL